MVKQLLAETTASGLKKAGSKWRVVLAAPGKGNSGTYTRDVLMQDGPAAFPAGTHSWIRHAAPEDRDPRDKLGTYKEGAYYDESFDLETYPDGALVADLTVRESMAAMVDEIADDASLSIYADGDKDPNGVVTKIYPGRANSVDLVAYGGLVGARLHEKLTESFSFGENTSGEPSAQDKEEGNVKPEELEKLLAAVSALTTKVDALTAAKTAEATADAAKLDEEEVGKKVDEALAAYDEKVVAIEAADLLPSQVETLKAEARKGVDVTPLIESAKKIAGEAKAQLSESLGGGLRLSESLNGKSESYSIGRWSA